MILTSAMPETSFTKSTSEKSTQAAILTGLMVPFSLSMGPADPIPAPTTTTPSVAITDLIA